MPHHSTPLDLAFHALSDPTRRAVVSRLAEGEAPVTTLASPFDMALPSFAQHLKVLEDCGLIATEKRGRSRWCKLVVHASRRRRTGWKPSVGTGPNGSSDWKRIWTTLERPDGKPFRQLVA